MNLPLSLSRIFVSMLLLIGCGRMQGDEPPETANLDSRAQLASQIHRNVEAGKRTIATAREYTKYMDDDAQAEFNILTRAADSAEKRLRRSLKHIENASPEEWPLARASLEASYEAYAQAIAQVERFLTVDAMAAERESDR